MTNEEAIEICRNIMPHRGTPVFEAFDMAIKALEQEPKTGHWINLERTKYKGQVLPFWGRYECSECGNHGQDDFNFCPNCGARMAESEEYGMTNEERKVVKGQMIKYGFKAPDMTVTEFVEDCLPSVTPTRPTGRWIEKEDYNLDTYYECSECGADYCIEGDILIHKYCPNCGARMTEIEDEPEEEEDEG